MCFEGVFINLKVLRVYLKLILVSFVIYVVDRLLVVYGCLENYKFCMKKFGSRLRSCDWNWKCLYIIFYFFLDFLLK